MNPATDSVSEKRERFAKLAREHQPLLTRIAMKFANGAESRAADYVQDTFVNAYGAFLRDEFRPESNAKAWLVRILTNVFLNENRRRTRWEAPVSVDDEESVPEHKLTANAADRPDARVTEHVLDGPIEVALASLPEAQRACVILVDIEGLDYAEAAEVLQVPIGTIRSRLARARLALHDRLVDYARSKGY